MTYTDTDLYILTATLYMEARNQGQEGITAVCNVILNRHKANRWYSHINKDYTISAICKKPFQFSCWNTGDQCDTVLPKANKQSDAWLLCADIAKAGLDGQLSDNTNGATHYYAQYIKPPLWVSSLDYCCQIGDHIFFKEKPGE